MATRLATYGYINAKIRARLSKLLGPPELSALISAATTDEVVELLRNTDYRDAASAIAETGDIRRAEALLFETEIRFITDIAANLSGKPGEFVKTLLLRYEVETLKRALRLWFERNVKNRDAGEESDYLYDGFSKIKVREVINAENLEEIAGLLEHTRYGDIMRETAASGVGTGLFAVEVSLDNLFFSALLDQIALLQKDDRKIARKLFGIEIDLENLERIVRFKEVYGLGTDSLAEYLIPSGAVPGKVDIGGSSGEIIRAFVGAKYPALTTAVEASSGESNLLMLGTILHEVLSIEVKRALLGYPFTLGIVLAYFFLKRREVRRIVFLLNAKALDLDEARVRNML
jgi:V/A-type H+-transporting ATPase subunit C